MLFVGWSVAVEFPPPSVGVVTDVNRLSTVVAVGLEKLLIDSVGQTELKVGVRRND